MQIVHSPVAKGLAATGFVAEAKGEPPPDATKGLEVEAVLLASPKGLAEQRAPDLTLPRCRRPVVVVDDVKETHARLIIVVWGARGG